MMCKHVKELLTQYAKGLLSEDMYADVDKHLETCASCRKLLQAENSVSSFLHLDDPSEDKGDLSALLRQRLDDFKQVEEKRLRDRILGLHPRHRWLIFISVMITLTAMAVILYRAEPTEYKLSPGYSSSGAGFTLMGMDNIHEQSDDMAGDWSGGISGAIRVLSSDNGSEDNHEDENRVVHTFDLSESVDDDSGSEMEDGE